jgi:hypothetical protein
LIGAAVKHLPDIMMRLRKWLPVAGCLLLLALLGLAVWVIPSVSQGAASVIVLGITNDAAGHRSALLCFTNASPVAVMGISDSVDYKTSEGWISQKLAPGTPFVGIAQFVVLKPHEAQVQAVRFPTNTSWKLRVNYFEQARGMEGLLSRTADFLSGLFKGEKTATYSGTSYPIVTSEIPN